MRKFFTALALLAMSVVTSAQIPGAPVSRVTDTTGQFTQAQVESLSMKLKGLEDKNGSQILVYVSDKIPGGMPIEDFANQAARKWKVGSSKSNYAAVYFVFKTDHKTRIEVARGLEGALTDTATKRIQEDAKPLLRAGNWYGGVNQVVDQIVGLAGTEPLKAAPALSATVVVQAEDDMSWVWVVLIIIGVIVLAAAIVIRIRTKMAEEAEEEEMRRRIARRTDTDYIPYRGRTVYRESEPEVDLTMQAVMAAEIVRHSHEDDAPVYHHSSPSPSFSDDSPSSSSWGSSSNSDDSSSSSSSSWSSSSDSGSSFDGGGSSSDF